MVTQVQVRGAANATQSIRTLVSREIDIDTTNKRLCVHDGSTVGGIQHVNSKDQQNQEFSFGTVTGTNAILLTLSVVPDAYASGQRFSFKAVNSNTGAVTINVNSLGAKSIKIVKSGVVSALTADDIIQDAIYTVTYNGTDFILESAGAAEDPIYNAGDVGSYALLRRITGGSAYSFGTDVAGSNLRPADVDNSSSGTVSGTWRCMGYQTGNTGSTLYHRIS